MKSNNWILITLLSASSAAFAADQTLSGQAVGNSAQASAHASASAGHAIAASGQATLGVSAIPLAIGGVVSGTAGAVSSQAARGSATAATRPIGAPLDITDETITIMPPDEALKNDNPSLKKTDKGI
ncbi:MAG: hypothetical protein NTY60_06715 [Proteobacteria bacterium]|nr:hypothetical protein [Pseudomonadota bacterium]